MDIIELKSRIKIEDIIRKYIKLEFKNDSNLKACCPFHSENSPSFLVDIKDQFFICFGCGCRGDVIRFISLYNNIDYKDAYNILAKSVGMLVDNDLDLINEVSDYYISRLGEINPFTKKRQLNKKLCNEWGLGYSGNIFDLGNEFKSSLTKLEELGLITIKNKNTPAEMKMSTLYDRMIIPIESQIGKIGFSGRTLSHSKIKYKNIIDNQYFSKKNSIYGIHKATQAIKDLDYTIIVEGYLDVIRMHQFNYKNTIGTQGLGLSEKIVKALRNLSKNIILLYDGDTAGQAALKRNIPELIKNGLSFEVIILPDGKDPDEYLLQGGSIESLELIPSIEIIKELFDREDINKILNKVIDRNMINKDILSLYKINLDISYKKPEKSNFKDKSIIHLGKWMYIALFLEVFPNFIERLNEDDNDHVEEAKLNDSFFVLKILNLFKKCKNPEEVFINLLKNN